MSDFTAVITVDQSPEEAFAAINNVRGWWSTEVVGDTDKLGDEFVFEVKGVHRSTMKLTEVVPGKRIVWHVSDSQLTFIKDTTEWDDTECVFDISQTGGRTEVRFTHVGLVPQVECYDLCSNAWGMYITGSLKDLITTGKGDPHTEHGTFDTELARNDKHRERAAS